MNIKRVLSGWLPYRLGGWSFVWRGFEVHIGPNSPNNTLYKSGFCRFLKLGPLKLVWQDE